MNRFTTDLVPNLQVTVRTVDLPLARPSLLRTPEEVRDVATDPVELLLMFLASVTVVVPFLPVTAHVYFFAVDTVNRSFAATKLGADVPDVAAGVTVVAFITFSAMTDFSVAAFFTPDTVRVGTRDDCPTDDLITIAFVPSTSNGMS